MEFKVDRKALVECLNELDGIRTAKSAYIATSFIMCDVKGSQLYLEATNYGISIRKCLGIENMGDDGNFSIENKMLKDILQDLKEAEISLSVDIDEEKSTTKFTVNDIVIKAEHFPADQFPVFPELAEDGKGTFIVSDLKGFKEILSKLNTAVSLDTSNLVLNGVYCNFQKGREKVFASTDTHMMMEIRTDLVDSAGKGFNFIMPRELISHLTKYMDKWRVAILVCTVYENKIRIDIGDDILIGNLIVGTYPDYAVVMIEHDDPGYERFTLNMKPLLKGMKFLRKFIDKSSAKSGRPEGGVTVSFEKDKVILEAGTGKISTILSDACAVAENFFVQLGYVRFDTVLKQLGDEKVYLDIKERTTPIGLSSDGFSYKIRAVLMPARDNWGEDSER